MKTMIQNTIRTMENKGDKRKSFTFKKWITAGILLVCVFPRVGAQQPAAAPASTPLITPMSDAELTSYRRFSLGLKLTHLYDLKVSSWDLLQNGTKVEDARGLNGSKTRFDLAAGLEASYFFGPMFSMDLSWEKGKMTGANSTEYYESNVSFLSLGANFSLKGSGRTTDYRWVPYARLSLSRGSYDAERKFLTQTEAFDTATGTAMIVGVGLGMRYHINDVWSLNLMSEYNVINTDAWDGYDYGSGRDQMLKTSIGIRYAFGKGKHIDRKPGWQDIRMDKVESRIDNKVNDAIKVMGDSMDARYAAMMSKPGIKDSDDDGIVDKYDKCPDVAGLFSNNGCPPAEEIAAQKTQDSTVMAKVNGMTLVIPGEEPAAEKAAVPAKANTGSSVGLSTEERYRLKNEIMVDMAVVRFPINSYQLNAKAYEGLNTIAVILRNNPAYKLSVQGYTDDAGSAEYNKKLAEQRANAVSEYLQSRGISKDRIRIVALGKDNPLDDNKSRVGKQNNRRVECHLE